MTVLFRSDMTAELIKANACDEDVARAAWVSNYGDDARLKDTGRIEGLINFLVREHHDSPMEHGQFTFFIECPIFVAREFVRHRTMSFNEWSGRYAELLPHFYIPSESRPLIQQGKVGQYTFAPGTPEQVAAVQQIQRAASENCWNAYQQQLDLGIAKEVARNVLGLNIYTKFYATVNPRNLFHFLKLRTAPNALEEIRMLAEQMETYVEKAMPITYAAFKEYR
jgi:thymidylate synthase (FAD)